MNLIQFQQELYKFLKRGIYMKNDFFSVIDRENVKNIIIDEAKSIENILGIVVGSGKRLY